MRICHICNKKLNSGSKHIYNCSKKHGENKPKEKIKFEFLKFNFPIISDKNELIKFYEKQLQSLPELKNKFNIDFKSLLFLLQFHKIKKRNSSESAKKISASKYKKTCQEKYGVDNVSKLENIKKQKAKTSKKNYGVDNIRKSYEFKNWLKTYMFNKYGAVSVPNNKNTADSWGWKKLTETEKQERLNKIHSNYKNNKLETRIQQSLNEIGISYTSQFFIGSNSFDIKISGIKLLIEIQGDYWHANPNKYNSEELIIYPSGAKTAKEIWQKDKNKNILATNKGYTVIYLWESEINIKTDEELKVLIFEKIMLWKPY